MKPKNNPPIEFKVTPVLVLVDGKRAVYTKCSLPTDHYHMYPCDKIIKSKAAREKAIREMCEKFDYRFIRQRASNLLYRAGTFLGATHGIALAMMYEHRVTVHYSVLNYSPMLVLTDTRCIKTVAHEFASMVTHKEGDLQLSFEYLFSLVKGECEVLDRCSEREMRRFDVGLGRAPMQCLCRPMHSSIFYALKSVDWAQRSIVVRVCGGYKKNKVQKYMMHDIAESTFLAE